MNSSTTRIKIQQVRLAFPALFEAASVMGGEPRFSANFIFPEDHPAKKQIEVAIQYAAQQKWRTHAAGMLKKLSAIPDKVCLRKGDHKLDKEGTVLEGFANNWFIQASNSVRPLLLDVDRTELTASTGKPYAGCYVNAHLELWAQDNNFGQRINATLLGVQFFKDGEPFTVAKVSNVDDFEDVGGGNDSELKEQYQIASGK